MRDLKKEHKKRDKVCKELFDVHCHMVPGVDDGAADLEESLAMLKMQHEDGGQEDYHHTALSAADV